MPPKLYLVTRRDLAAGLAAAQIAHAAILWATSRPIEEVREWMEKSNTVVICTVADEAELKEKLATAPAGLGFADPDINGELTAIALDPGNSSKKECRGLPLFLA
jgi:hypothetical protein